MDKKHQITLSEAFSRIDQISDQLSRYATNKARGIDLVKAIKNACEIYLSLANPQVTGREINSFAIAIRSRPMDVPLLLSQLSTGTRDLISQHDDIPDEKEFLTPVSKTLALRRLMGAITISEQSRVRQGRKRKHIRNIGQKKRDVEQEGPDTENKKSTRPKHTTEAILVAYLAAALAKATDRPSTRSWSENTKSPDGLSDIERLVEDVLVALDIDDQHSAKQLVRRHIEERNRLSLKKG